MEGTARGLVPFLLANQPSDWRINPARPGPANDNLDIGPLEADAYPCRSACCAHVMLRPRRALLVSNGTFETQLVCKSFLIEDWAAELRRRSRR